MEESIEMSEPAVYYSPIITDSQMEAAAKVCRDTERYARKRRIAANLVGGLLRIQNQNEVRLHLQGCEKRALKCRCDNLEKQLEEKKKNQTELVNHAISEALSAETNMKMAHKNGEIATYEKVFDKMFKHLQ